MSSEHDPSQITPHDTGAGAPEPAAGPGVQPTASGPEDALLNDPIATDSADRSTRPEEAHADPLLRALEKLSAQFEDLARAFDDRISYDKAKEEAFARLYADLDQHKRNAAQDNIRPLLLDLILLYDRIEHANVTAAPDRPDGSIPVAVSRSFGDELLEIMYRQNVTLIEDESPVFNPNLQRAIGVAIVADAACHQHVVEIVRRGFRVGSRILRPEEVIVGRLAEPDAHLSGPDGDGGGKL